MRAWDTLILELEHLSDRMTSLSELRTWTERSRLVDDVIGKLRYAGVIGDDETLPEIDEGRVQQVDEFLRVIGDAIKRLQGWKAMKIVDRESVLRTLGPEFAAVSDLSARTQMTMVMERLQLLNRLAIDKRLELAKARIDAAIARIDGAIERAGLDHRQCADERAEAARRISQTGRPRFTPFVEARLKQDHRAAKRTMLKVRAAGAGGWLRSILDAISSVNSQLPG
jgi:hypothetical protein